MIFYLCCVRYKYYIKQHVTCTRRRSNMRTNFIHQLKNVFIGFAAVALSCTWATLVLPQKKFYISSQTTENKTGISCHMKINWINISLKPDEIFMAFTLRWFWSATVERIAFYARNPHSTSAPTHSHNAHVLYSTHRHTQCEKIKSKLISSFKNHKIFSKKMRSTASHNEICNQSIKWIYWSKSHRLVRFSFTYRLLLHTSVFSVGWRWNWDWRKIKMQTHSV